MSGNFAVKILSVFLQNSAVYATLYLSFFPALRHSLIPTYIKRRPNKRRIQSLSILLIMMETNRVVNTPAMVHQSAARHTIRRCLMCPISAIGAQAIKYSRLMPPAIYCSCPITAVRYSTNNEPPPIPNPLIMPVNAPMIMLTAVITAIPPLSHQTIAIRRTVDAAIWRICCGTVLQTTVRLWLLPMRKAALLAIRCFLVRRRK